MRQNDTAHPAVPTAPAFGRYRSTGRPDTWPERIGRSTRFVTQSHALGTPMANPASLIVAAAIAVAVYFVGRRLAD